MKDAAQPRIPLVRATGAMQVTAVSQDACQPICHLHRRKALDNAKPCPQGKPLGHKQRPFQTFLNTSMPFIRTSVHKDTPPEQRKAIVDGIHQALVDGIGMPADELFNLVSDYDEQQFFFSRTFNGYNRSDRVVVVEITMRRGRSDAMKRALYANIASNLEKNAGVAPNDVFIFTHENDYSDWSVGGGKFAMAIAQQVGPDA